MATPHIGGSTEEAQETVGVRIAQQIVEYLQNGAALHAVNLPALTPEQYKTLGPYGKLAERLGSFASYISTGNPKAVRLVYFGKIAEFNTHLVRNAGLAGVLQRSLARNANSINAMQIAGDRGLTVAERHEKRVAHIDSVRLDLETDTGITSVEGAVVMEEPRLIQIDGTHCEATLAGNLTFVMSEDVPGVIGYIGDVFGKNGVNIATFSLGRREAGTEAISVIQTDQPVARQRGGGAAEESSGEGGAAGETQRLAHAAGGSVANSAAALRIPQHGFEQSARVGGARIAKHLLGGAGFDDLAALQNRDARAKRRHRQQIVRDEQHRHVQLAIQAAEQIQDFALRDGVQRAGGLVGDQQAGLVQHGHGDQDALRLADAQLPRITIQKRFFGRQADALEELQRPRLP